MSESKPGTWVSPERLPSRSFGAVEKQRDVVMGKKRGCKHVDVGWGFLTRAVSSKAKVWAATGGVDLATSWLTHCLLQGAWQAAGLLFMDII